LKASYLPISLWIFLSFSFLPLHAQDANGCAEWSYDYNGNRVCIVKCTTTLDCIQGRINSLVSAEKGMEGVLDAFGVRLQHAEESGARAEAAVKPLEDRLKSLEDRLNTSQNGAESAASAEAAVKPLEERIKSLEDRLKTVPTAGDSAAAVKSLDGRLTAVENSVGSSTNAQETVKSLEGRIRSLEDRLKTFPTAGDSAAAVKSLDGRLSAVENSVGSATNAQETVKSLEGRIRSLEDRPNNTLGGVTEALRANLRAVPNECRFDSKNHRCSARCNNDEIVISGGCYGLNNDAGAIVSSAYLSSETGPSNQYTTWSCIFYDMRDIHPDWPPLTRVGAVAYCAKLP
jgi:BMFP domain-containing protein YqiC